MNNAVHITQRWQVTKYFQSSTVLNTILRVFAFYFTSLQEKKNLTAVVTLQIQLTNKY